VLARIHVGAILQLWRDVGVGHQADVVPRLSWTFASSVASWMVAYSLTTVSLPSRTSVGAPCTT